ncbi:MAG: nodulation protein NodZ [Thermoanaerobaculia bacterium]|nr:nodulation protein NodZ [Thermoanaerobaculia bacterium]
MARVVVSKKVGGLGACLVTLFRAWQFAQRTGRLLVVDWRASLYADDPRVNAFDRLFANRDEIAGVPIVTGERVAALAYAEPVFPPGWTAERLHGFPDRYYTAAALDGVDSERLGSRRDQFELCLDGDDLPHPTVVLHHGLRSPAPVDLDGDHFPRVDAAAARRFLAALEPVAEVRAAAARFAGERLARRPVVGLHVRHGNGELEERAAGVFTRRLNRDPSALLEAYRAALVAAGRDAPATLFLATDSAEVQACFAAAFPDLVVYPKWMPPPGRGALHARAGGSGGCEALVEMRLLAGCDALVHNDSCFTFYPLFGADHAWRTRVAPPPPPSAVTPAGAPARAATIRSTAAI